MSISVSLAFSSILGPIETSSSCIIPTSELASESLDSPFMSLCLEQIEMHIVTYLYIYWEWSEYTIRAQWGMGSNPRRVYGGDENGIWPLFTP